MRWDRLFAELEAQADDEELLERDALIADLRDEELGSTSWRDLLSGAVELEVVGAGRVEGRAEEVTEQWVRLSGRHRDHVVSLPAVLSLRGGDGRRPAPGPLSARLGWSALFRAVRDEAEAVRVVRRDGTTVEGDIVAVLADAVSIGRGERRWVIPYAQLAAVTPGGG